VTEPAANEQGHTKADLHEGEKRLLTRVALIGAAAALLGAVIGGGSSYLATHDQQRTKIDQARIERRKAAYADYLTVLIDLETAEYNCLKKMESGQMRSADDFNPCYADYGAAEEKWSKSLQVVTLVQSDNLQKATSPLTLKHNDIYNLLADINDAYAANRPEDALKRTVEFRNDWNTAFDLDDAFVAAARVDVN
jgi:hypothetical protein